MKSIETSGKTVEDAIRMGLQELRLDSTDVIIDVLDMGSPGLFGMFGRLAKVRLTVKEKLDDFDFEIPRMTLDEQSPKRQQEKKKQESAPRLNGTPAQQPSKHEGAPAPIQNKRNDASSAQNAKRETAPQAAKAEPAASTPVQSKRDDAAVKPAKRENAHARTQNKRGEGPRKASAPEGEAPEQKTFKSPRPTPYEPVDLPVRPLETLSDAERVAYDFLSDLTKLMGVAVEVRIRTGDEQMSVQLIGDTLGILIGRRGETLDALQYLTSLQVNKGRDEYIRVSLDTEHYRAKREDALQKLASRMAARARKTGHRVVLEPMNPYERRILHSALQNHPYVTTHSEGEEPYRRVIITLK